MTTKTKLSDFIPPLGQFIRMPAGTVVFYPVEDCDVSHNIGAAARRVGGRITTEAVTIVSQRNCTAERALKCTVVTPGAKRKKPGPKK